ncbi:protein of unknown function [Serratia sp. Tan611]|nr:protein of unknown function [Serratia sp. Tan611]
MCMKGIAHSNRKLCEVIHAQVNRPLHYTLTQHQNNIILITFYLPFPRDESCEKGHIHDNRILLK